MPERATKPGRSIRTSLRLSLQFAFLYSVLSGLMFIGAYWATEYEIKKLSADQLSSDAGTFTSIYRTDGAEALIFTITALSEVNFESARIFQLLDENGHMVAGNILDDVTVGGSEFLPAEGLHLSAQMDEDITRYWVRSDAVGPYTLIQGAGNHIVTEVLEALGIALIVGYLLVVGLGLLFGVRVGWLTERSISSISNTLAKISEGQLDARIPLAASAGDDLTRVSADINATLEQLKHLLQSQEQITTDIAHDLRTPLQRLHQRLEKMLTAERVSPEDVEASMRQTEEIISAFNALLRIAQIEAVGRQAQFADVDLNVIVGNVVDLFEPACEENGQALEFRPLEANAFVIGDRDLLMQLFSNLIENATTHCPADTTIEVTIEQDQSCIVVVVSDNGPGIEDADRERIFTRFYRAEKSRHTPGNGLGLPLAKAIADMHGASLEVADRAPGVAFSVRFCPGQ